MSEKEIKYPWKLKYSFIFLEIAKLINCATVEYTFYRHTVPVIVTQFVVANFIFENSKHIWNLF